MAGKKSGFNAVPIYVKRLDTVSSQIVFKFIIQILGFYVK